MMRDAFDISCILKHAWSSHVLSSVYRAFETLTEFAGVSAFVSRPPPLATTARLAAAVTYTRPV
eukprot:1348353-Pyramimonas_sp.AAC.1